MYLRDATLGDIPRLVEIWLVAFLEDTSYNAVFPWRKEFPDEYQRLWTTKITTEFLQAEGGYLVVETDVIDGKGRSGKEVVGWALWTRKGSSQAAKKIRADNDTASKGKASSDALERNVRANFPVYRIREESSRPKEDHYQPDPPITPTQSRGTPRRSRGDEVLWRV